MVNNISILFKLFLFIITINFIYENMYIINIIS